MNPDYSNVPKNVTLTFENGYTLSLSFGSPMSYGNGSAALVNGSVHVTGTVETAIFDLAGNFVPYKGDDVQGWQTADDVQETVLYVKGLVYEIDED